MMKKMLGEETMAKIRTGFVSNSSSSSFVAWGVDKDSIPLSNDIILNLFNKRLLELDTEKFPPNSYEGYLHRRMSACNTIEDKLEFMEESCYNTPTGIELGGEEMEFVGISPTTIYNKYPEVTFGGVHEFVATKLNEAFGTNLTESDITYTEEGWYSG
jgi:hypothetical protein